MTPKCGVEVLSSAPKCKEAAVCLMKKSHMLDKLHSCVSYSVVGCEFIPMDQQFILNKVSLNSNTHKTSYVLIS